MFVFSFFFSKSTGLTQSDEKDILVRKVLYLAHVVMEFSFMFLLSSPPDTRRETGSALRQKDHIYTLRAHTQGISQPMDHEQSHHSGLRTPRSRHITLFQRCLGCFWKRTDRERSADTSPRLYLLIFCNPLSANAG